jgi:hypothetical protein
VKALLGLSQQKGGYDMFVCFLLVCFDLVGKGGVFHKGRCCGIYCWNLVAFFRLYNFSFCLFFLFFFTGCFLCCWSVYGVRMGCNSVYVVCFFVLRNCGCCRIL